MTDPAGPLDLIATVAAALDELGIPHVLGGSMASSLIGEPRSTLDIDIAVSIEPNVVEEVLTRMAIDFYVPTESARRAIAEHSSFNLLDRNGALKVDLFVLGDGILDRQQLARRQWVVPEGRDEGLWVTSPEDQILRKLDWFRAGDRVSDHQWRDILGILRVQAGHLDLDYLVATATTVGLDSDLATAMRAADGPT